MSQERNELTMFDGFRFGIGFCNAVITMILIIGLGSVIGLIIMGISLRELY